MPQTFCNELRELMLKHNIATIKPIREDAYINVANDDCFMFGFALNWNKDTNREG
jgi:hypothetical protein